MKKTTLLLAVSVAIIGIQSTSFGAIVNNWVNWSAPSSYISGSGISYASGTTGTIQLPNGDIVNVSLSGEILGSFSASVFGSGSNTFWSEKNYNNNTYLSANVPNLPTNSDRIGLSGYAVPLQTLTFSQPVSNIVMNVWSMGADVIDGINSYSFNQPFTILSSNAGQYPSMPYSLSASGNTLSGFEGAGTIQFTGTFTSLSWNVTAPELYSVWNIGVTSASASAAAVPEPGQVAASLLLLAGIGGYVFLKRRKAAKTVAPAAA
jgi:hypothetical protein